MPIVQMNISSRARIALAPGVVVGTRFDASRNRLPKEEPYMTAYASMVLLSRVGTYLGSK